MEFRNYISEAIDLDKYKASYKKDEDGFRALVVNPEGKASYLSAISWKTKEDAIKASEFYISILNKPTGRMDSEMNKYETKNSSKIVKD